MLIESILASYIVTKTITESYLLLPFRKAFRTVMWHTPFRKKFTLTFDGKPMLEDQNAERGEGFDFITCRLCTGFYVSIVTMQITGQEITLLSFLAVWGGEWFLTTQERKS